MNKKDYYRLLSMILLGLPLVWSCFPSEKLTDKRSSIGAATIEPVDDPLASNTEENYKLSWDLSEDASIIAYKIFVVPPGSLARAPGSDGPVEVNMIPVADLIAQDGKYAIEISDSQIMTALGSTDMGPMKPCFTLVAVNNIGNSAHSPRICME